MKETFKLWHSRMETIFFLLAAQPLCNLFKAETSTFKLFLNHNEKVRGFVKIEKLLKTESTKCCLALSYHNEKPEKCVTRENVKTINFHKMYEILTFLHEKLFRINIEMKNMVKNVITNGVGHQAYELLSDSIFLLNSIMSVWYSTHSRPFDLK